MRVRQRVVELERLRVDRERRARCGWAGSKVRARRRRVYGDGSTVDAEDVRVRLGAAERGDGLDVDRRQGGRSVRCGRRVRRGRVRREGRVCQVRGRVRRVVLRRKGEARTEAVKVVDGLVRGRGRGRAGRVADDGRRRCRGDGLKVLLGDRGHGGPVVRVRVGRERRVADVRDGRLGVEAVAPRIVVVLERLVRVVLDHAAARLLLERVPELSAGPVRRRGGRRRRPRDADRACGRRPRRRRADAESIGNAERHAAAVQGRRESARRLEGGRRRWGADGRSARRRDGPLRCGARVVGDAVRERRRRSKRDGRGRGAKVGGRRGEDVRRRLERTSRCRHLERRPAALVVRARARARAVSIDTEPPQVALDRRGRRDRHGRAQLVVLAGGRLAVRARRRRVVLVCEARLRAAQRRDR